MPHKGGKWKSPMYKRSDGQSLVDWCNENGFNYHTLRQRIIDEDISVDEACASANRKRMRREWETDGLSLRQYCIEKILFIIRYIIGLKFWACLYPRQNKLKSID